MIQLRAKIKNSSEVTKTTTFPMPPDGENILYDDETQTPLYFAYLVKVTASSASTITFTGINRQNPSATMTSYSLDLAKVHYVWPGTPSSLKGWNAATNNCAILFLTNDYVSGDGVEPAKPDLQAAREDPGNKWPKGSGDAVQISNLQGQIRDLQKRLVDADVLMARIRGFQGMLSGESKSRFDSMFSDIIS